MTIKEAITLFGGAATELVGALAKPENNTTQLQRCINAYDMAISALRAQQLESNEPLTVDELREMDGEPVYIHSDTFPGDCGWRVVKKASVLDIQFTDGDCFLFTFYGKSWIAYRRKPKKGGYDG